MAGLVAERPPPGQNRAGGQARPAIDIRRVQELLGHVRLDTTQIYTHVSIRKLKQVHSARHPGAKLERRVGDEGEER